ncbi:hypothetical protein [Paenibacillus hexagrammi]|uniref:Uncharacterized protein n=1 Tax=Paenibacillus hexagrammi TaxID=2908839 RepID=A0ABY3SG32_9BACL|nr:hypothetical protein [Paenibacillus sp. YPD9-1]UJF32792.1 hypothetical protein L0M14_24930 [Paenibacillus sp. YPD9-1]
MSSLSEEFSLFHSTPTQKPLLISIDYFIPNLSIPYGGKLIQNHPVRLQNPSFSGGTATYSVSPDSAIQLDFNGDGITWIGYSSDFNGCVNVYIDHKLATSKDLYSSTLLLHQTLFETDGLPNGAHTISIQANGKKHEDSKGYNIGTDYFVISDRNDNSVIQDTDSRVTYINANHYAYLDFVARKMAHFIEFFILSAGLMVGGVICYQ